MQTYASKYAAKKTANHVIDMCCIDGATYMIDGTPGAYTFHITTPNALDAVCLKRRGVSFGVSNNV